MNFTTSFRGLDIGYTVEDYTPAVHTLSNGDPGYPAEGGCCDHWEIEDIDDPDEVAFELGEAWEPKGLLERFMRWAFLFLLARYETLRPKDRGRIFDITKKLVDEHWSDDIFEHCTEHYWHDLGGPGCEADYFYDG